ncbi:TPA: hypothetical protein P4F59_001664 [Escherichia coli]|nr:hypothetical protein [Escherichia coli]EGU1896473.1 hypothetical protein [Escherichia coli]HBM9618855.1 hypothetical protein [Escherichia coli]HDO7446062.1 hypothetical protein [Escherichia coli]
MTITKQRVEEIISRIEMYGHGAGYTAEEVYDLAAGIRVYITWESLINLAWSAIRG